MKWIQALKAPHHPEDTALQVFANQYYLDLEVSLEKQFEENKIQAYRYLFLNVTLSRTYCHVDLIYY
jgi:hypothetical protein